MLRSKSDSDLSGVVIDILGFNTFIPKEFTGFSKKYSCIFYPTPTMETTIGEEVDIGKTLIERYGSLKLQAS